jgi:hypothetical protein
MLYSLGCRYPNEGWPMIQDFSCLKEPLNPSFRVQQMDDKEESCFCCTTISTTIKASDVILMTEGATLQIFGG